MHPDRVAALGQPSVTVSSLRDTESEISYRGRMRGGAGSNRATGGADGGADRAAGAANPSAAGAAGNGGRGGARDPPPPSDPPPSDHGGARGRCKSRPRRRIEELEFAKPIKIREPKRFEGRPGDDFETW
jgi:hypothetical protein